jgi:hypothetical protein
MRADVLVAAHTYVSLERPGESTLTVPSVTSV